jgi:hypothetical protein
MNRFRHTAIVFSLFSLELFFAPARLPGEGLFSYRTLVLNR